MQQRTVTSFTKNMSGSTNNRPGPDHDGDIARILDRVRAREPGAVDDLIAYVREDLYRTAAAKLRGSPGAIDPTALVHDAFVKMFASREPTWENRRHFFMAASRAMRDVLVDHSRRDGAKKRGGGVVHIEFTDHHAEPAETLTPHRVLELDEVLKILEDKHPDWADIVRLRFFAGLTEAEIAEVLGTSTATVGRHWSATKDWLLEKLRDEP